MTASITVPRMYSDAEGECRFDSYDVLLTLQDVAPLAAPFCTSDCLSGSLRFVESGGASGTPVEGIIGSIDAAQFQECNPARLAAFTWSNADDQIGTELGRGLSGARGFTRSSRSKSRSRTSPDDGR
jgi:hypothetical protein